MQQQRAVTVTLAAVLMVATACSDDRMTATEEGGIAIQMDVASGDQQMAEVGTQLPDAVVVLVLDANGNPVSGQIVNFRVTQGGGSVYGGASLSDQAGQAQEWWTLGPNPGANTLEARAVDTSSGQKLVFATFTADGFAAGTVASVAVSPTTANLQVSGTHQFNAAVHDANGNDVAGATATWSSSSAGVATVNAQGLAQAMAAGTTTITAASGGQSGTATVTVAAANNPVPTVTSLTPSTGSVGSAGFTLVVRGTGYVGNSTVQWNGTARTTTFISATELRAAIPSSALASTGTAQVRVVTPAPGGGTSNALPYTITSQPVATVTVSPATANVASGAQLQLTAVLRDANGQTLSGRTLSWSSSGATVASVNATSGMVQGVSAGSATITATSEGKTGTAAVTVTTTPPPPPPPPPGNYQTVVGSNWNYGSKAELRSADFFWWYLPGDVYNYVDLVPDQTFGQVVRVHFAQSSQEGYAPKITASFAPLDKMWYRFRVRWQPGFTTKGANPAGYANSWKMAFWTWEGYQSRGQIEFSNTNEYIMGMSVREPSTGAYVRYTETELPGSQSWGKTTTEWTDGQWWEYVVYWEKTGATTARQHQWRRRLTNNGVVANNAYTYIGWSYSGATTPRVRAIDLGANKNKSNDADMYLFWGPWEVVDGSVYPNPWAMNLP
jgi:uncharacterized protein YjdB